MLRVRIELGHYVVATRATNGIRVRSVGLVTNVSGERITVFYIGASKAIETDSNHIVYLDIKKTGKPYEKKICNICHLLKVRMKEFARNQTDAQGRPTTRPSCKDCRKKFIDGKKLTALEKRRLMAIKPKDLFTCPLCQKMTIVGTTANIVIDHDHKTGSAREWICDSCNTGLGRFKDDPMMFERIIEYFKKHSE